MAETPTPIRGEDVSYPASWNSKKTEALRIFSGEQITPSRLRGRAVVIDLLPEGDMPHTYALLPVDDGTVAVGELSPDGTHCEIIGTSAKLDFTVGQNDFDFSLSTPDHSDDSCSPVKQITTTRRAKVKLAILLPQQDPVIPNQAA